MQKNGWEKIAFYVLEKINKKKLKKAKIEYKAITSKIRVDTQKLSNYIPSMQTFMYCKCIFFFIYYLSGKIFYQLY